MVSAHHDGVSRISNMPHSGVDGINAVHGSHHQLEEDRPWPSYQVTYLGLCLDAVSMTATITQEWWAVTGDVLEKCVAGGRIRYVLVKRLLGLLSSAYQVVPLGLLYMRCLQLWYKGIHRTFRDKPQFNSRFVLVPLEIAPDLNHSRRVVTDRAGVPMVPKGLETTIYTDASLLGWGPSWAHIKALEMEVVSHILIMTDSMTTKACINR